MGSCMRVEVVWEVFCSVNVKKTTHEVLTTLYLWLLRTWLMYLFCSWCESDCPTFVGVENLGGLWENLSELCDFWGTWRTYIWGFWEPNWCSLSSLLLGTWLMYLCDVLANLTDIYLCFLWEPDWYIFSALGNPTNVPLWLLRTWLMYTFSALTNLTDLSSLALRTFDSLPLWLFGKLADLSSWPLGT